MSVSTGRSLAWPARFWDRVTASEGCWVWEGSCYPRGYGKVSYFGVQAYTHRVAYQITYGPIPNELHVCHHCDNPPCVRPDHLFLGTVRDNMLDREAKGRGYFSRPGVKELLRELLEASPKWINRNVSGQRLVRPKKLTPDQITSIRQRAANGEATQSAMAREFGVSTTYVGNIVHGKKCSKWGAEVAS